MAGTDVHVGRDYIAFEVALQRARADFMEMPGLRLTPFQAQRLWTLEPEVCREVLRQLVEMRFLTRSISNTFSRTVS